MRSTTNEKLIERQSKLARYTTLGGMALLLASLVTTFTSNFPIGLAYLLLFIGFGLAYVGAMLANKWVKEPRADHALAKALKGFDNRHHLYNYVLPVSHVLLTPTGLVVFKVKPNSGRITCEGERCRGAWQWSRLFGGMGQEPLGNPIVELRSDISKIMTLLTNKIDGAGVVPIDGFVVFTDPKVQLTVENPSMPIVQMDNLKETLRKERHRPPLAPKLFESLKAALDDEANAKAA
jgi:hypothetical protein